MSKELLCWKCGASLAALSLPLRRLEECPACSTELHVCKMCEFYDPRVAKSCREPVAEEVKEKERANFCDYFSPTPKAYRPRDQEAAKTAASELEALFSSSDACADGADPADPDKVLKQAEALFERRNKDEGSTD